MTLCAFAMFGVLISEVAKILISFVAFFVRCVKLRCQKQISK